MPSNPEGLKIALTRIAQEKQDRTGFLDLGMLGLTEWPEELWELDHLLGLNLGFRWTDFSGVERTSEPLMVRPDQNRFNLTEARWLRLSRLQLLSISGRGRVGSNWQDLSSLCQLTALRSLNCANTQVASLKSIAQLRSLQLLNCSDTKIDSLEPLSQVTTLQSLMCRNTQISELHPLAQLICLEKLNLSSTKIIDLKALAGLGALQSLIFSRTRVRSLAPLLKLTSLQLIDCSHTPIKTLDTLSELTELRWLSCRNTQVSSLAPLTRLTALQSLNCSSTKVISLEPLSQLRALRWLQCASTQINSLNPIKKNIRIESIICYSTKINNLEPLTQLTKLHSLNFSSTGVNNLGPLSKLTALGSLNCDDCPVTYIPLSLVNSKRFQVLYCRGANLPEVPAEVLSSKYADNCLPRLRAHLRDLRAGSTLLPDVKVLVLGNGRIGKTQICNRLRAQDFDAQADSTHGITVTTTPFEDAQLRLWDFGGQDLYHGTHALFMRTRAIFLLVWTPNSEDSKTHDHGGITFRNQPLAWWLAYVRHLAGTDSPVLIIQNQCDRPEDELRQAPLEDTALKEFSFRKELNYSALNDRGRPALNDTLHQAIAWLRERQGQARIGIGRLAVKQRIEALQNADAAISDVSQRRHRTITQDHFQAICDECQNVSDHAMLLQYLHQSGVLFYHRGLFDDQIILDQAWALDAIYAVFNRQKCWQQLRQLKGRFTRTLLEALVWQQHSEGEQKLFLSMMQSCGICFIHREEDEKLGIETEYLAPDLLPNREDVDLDLEDKWDNAMAYHECKLNLPFLHPAIIRGLISRVGQAAGMTAIYWKDGVCVYERATRSHAYIEQRFNSEDRSWSGSVFIRTQGVQSLELAKLFKQWAQDVAVESSLRLWSWSNHENPQSATAPKQDHAAAETEPTPLKPEFTEPPRDKTTFGVSYAWNDASTDLVTKLCNTATANHRITILRDKTGMGLGESITKFMRTLTAQDRIFVILSAKYLQSPYCMYELWQIWMNCRADDEEFRSRIRVYRLDDAAMMTPIERARCAKYWKDQFKELDELVRTEGADLLGESDFKRYKLMQDFANRVGDILSVIADTLLPQDFAQLEQHGFS